MAGVAHEDFPFPPLRYWRQLGERGFAYPETGVGLRQGPAGRIQDVYLNGDVSEVAILRGNFAEPLKAGGADELLKLLRERTAGMLAAKPAP